MSERAPLDTGSPRADGDRLRHPRADTISRRLCRSRVHERLFGKRLETLKIGRFILLEPIGAGSMGEIYAAYDERLDRKVAIKLLHEGMDTSPVARQRLLREAQILARLSHPNVVHVYEVGEFQGRVFIAMEFVPGRTLREWLHTATLPGGRPTMPEVLRHFVAAGRGLEAAHDAGLVHRDFKPTNVLIGDDGRARVLDFGVARAILVRSPAAETAAAVAGERGPAVADPELLRAAITQTTIGRLMGTPGYMSPEQLRGAEADHRSDQFSFCVALYEALYGERPFSGATLDELRQSVESGAIRETARHSRVPTALRKALLRGLSVDPDRRFDDMATLLSAIEEPTSDRRPWSWLLAGVAVLALVWLLISRGFAPWNRDNEPPTPPQTPIETPCGKAGSAMEQVWNDEVRERIEQVFAGSDMAAGELVREQVFDQIEKYQRAWGAASERACRETHVQGTWSAEALAASTACLERGRIRLHALLRELESGDTRAQVSAPDVLAELYAPEACISPEFLENPVDPPASAIAARVLEIREQLAKAHNRRISGYYADAVDLAETALAGARELEYKPLLAEAEHELGASRVFRGRPGDIESADVLLEQAARDALASRHDQLLVNIWHDRMLSAVLFHPTMDQASQWARDAEAAIERAGGTPRLRALHLRLRGLMAAANERYPEAIDFHEQALAIANNDPDYPAVWRAAHLHDLGTAVRRSGYLDAARFWYELAISTLHGKVLDAHPRLAEIRFDLASLASQKGNLEDALIILNDVLKVHERALGSDHRLAGKAHLEIARVKLDKAQKSGNAADLSSAGEHLQRAYDSYQPVYGEDHVKLAGVYNFAGALAYLHRCPGAALAWYQRALSVQQATWDDSGRIDLGYTWANIAEARLDLGQYESAEAAIREAENTRAGKEIADFIKGLRNRLASERGTPPPATTPEHCQKPVLVVKTSPRAP